MTDKPRKEAVAIGYVPVDLTSAIAFPAPRILVKSRSIPLSFGAVQACPAVNTFESRTIEILAPFSLRLRCVAEAGGRYNFHLVEEGTRLDESLIRKHLTFVSRSNWRVPNAPVVQVALPHFFVCDETCFVTQTPAWASKSQVQIPGNFISGRFPTNVWPRSLNLAFEWTDFGNDLIMRRGEAVCYLTLETREPERPIRLVPAKLTAELQEYRTQIEDVAKYTSGAFNLFEAAEKVRPARLLEELVS